MVQQSHRALVIIKVKTDWALRAYQTCYVKHFSLNSHKYFMCKFYSYYFTDEKAEAKWALNTHPTKHHQNLNAGIPSLEPSSYCYAEL